MSPRTDAVRLWLTPMEPELECTYRPCIDERGGSTDIFGTYRAYPACNYVFASTYPGVTFWWDGLFTPDMSIGYHPNSRFGGFASGVVGPQDPMDAYWQWDLSELFDEIPAICTVHLETNGEADPWTTIEASNDGSTWDTIIDFDWNDAGVGAAVTTRSFPSPFLTYRYWRERVYYVHPGGYFAGISNTAFMLFPAVAPA